MLLMERTCEAQGCGTALWPDSARGKCENELGRAAAVTPLLPTARGGAA